MTTLAMLVKRFPRLLATSIAQLRTAAVRISTELRGAAVTGASPDHLALLQRSTDALFHVVGGLKEIDRRLRRLDAERTYLRRHGEE